MKRSIPFLLTLSLFLSVWAGQILAANTVIQSGSMRDRMVTYYNEHIDMEIAIAKEYASLKVTDSPRAKCFGERAAKQVEFLESHREELVRAMLDADIEMQPFRAHEFLYDAFLRAHPEVTPIC